MQHSFDVQEAVNYGLPEAVMIWNLRFWIVKNKANNKHEYAGEDGILRTWTYNTNQAFQKLFPYWSGRQIEHLLSKMFEKEILVKGNFNENKHIRTTWYAFQNEEKMLSSALIIPHFTNLGNGNHNFVESKSQNPEMEITKTRNVYKESDIKPNNKTHSLEEVEIFWKELKERENYKFDFDCKNFFDWCSDEDLKTSWKNIMKKWVKKPENQIKISTGYKMSPVEDPEICNLRAKLHEKLPRHRNFFFNAPIIKKDGEFLILSRQSDKVYQINRDHSEKLKELKVELKVKQNT